MTVPIQESSELTTSLDMKVFLVALSVFAVCLAGESFPPNTFQNSDDLYTVNAAVMERLRQEAGSERGAYHVFLPDGRLQRVQYTAAPVNQQQQTASYKSEAATDDQNFGSPRSAYYVQVPAERLQALRAPASQDSQGFQPSYQPRQTASYKSEVATDGQSFESPRSAYYVQVPAERLQALRATASQDSQRFQPSFQPRQQAKSAAYSQPLEVDAQFVPLQVVSAEQYAQARSQ